MTDQEFEILKLKKEIWEKAIDTQMHFNEMSVKSRQLGLTFVVAALGITAVLISKDVGMHVPITIFESIYNIHIGAFVVLIAALGLIAVGTLDLRVYHKMLRGAVTFGEAHEKDLIKSGLISTPIGMTQCISLYSRYDNDDIDKTTLSVSESKKESKAEKRILKFYIIVTIVLLLISTVLAYSLSTVESLPKNTSAVNIEKK